MHQSLPPADPARSMAKRHFVVMRGPAPERLLRGGGFEPHTGAAGWHAEVLAVNDALNQIEPNATIGHLRGISAATFKVSPAGSGQGIPFPTCSNYSGFLPYVRILTGRK